MSAQLLEQHYGASPDEWAHFSLILGLTADLLPVVSNPHAEISPESKMKAVGKTPSHYNGQGKAAGIANWTQRTSTDADITRWARQRDYGICLQTREVRALDLDLGNAEAVRAVRAVVAEFWLDLPMRWRGNSPKCLLAFHLPGEYTKRILRTAHGAVEFLATGQQFVAAGTHPSGARYEWAGGLPDAFPVITPDQFEALWGALTARFATEPPTESSASVKAAKLAEAATNDPIAQYLAERGLVKRTERDGRLHIVCPWEHEHTADTGDAATTYWPAHTGGYANGHFHCLHAHCEHRTDDEFKEAIGFVDPELLADFEALGDHLESQAQQAMAPDSPVNGDRPKDKPRNRFALVPAHEFAAMEAPPWIIKGVLPQAELAVIFGESGSGKTFAILDMAMAIARGEPWRGLKTRKGRVVYVAAEGAGGLRQRLKAYAHQHGLRLEDLPISIIASAPNMLQKQDALDVAKAVIDGGGADVIILDTFAQVTPGGNENSGEDVGKALGHCRGIHRATGGLVVLVHHAGKDTAKGARGWSGLRAAADAELEVVRSDEDRVITVTKQKDGMDGAEFGFRLATVLLGYDEDGEDITSCVVDHCDTVPTGRRKREPRGAKEKVVWGVVNNMLGLGMGEVPVSEVIDSAVNQIPHDGQTGKRDTRRQHCMRALESLIEGNRLQVSGGMVRLAE